MSQSPLEAAFCIMSPVTMVFGDGPIFIPPPAIPPPPPPPPPPGEHAVAATSVAGAAAAYHPAQCLIPHTVEGRTAVRPTGRRRDNPQKPATRDVGFNCLGAARTDRRRALRGP